ncbi:putative PLC-like phosphodiesterase [Seiridium cardinale]
MQEKFDVFWCHIWWVTQQTLSQPTVSAVSTAPLDKPNAAPFDKEAIPASERPLPYSLSRVKTPPPSSATFPLTDLSGVMIPEEHTPLLDSKKAVYDGPPAAPFATALMTPVQGRHGEKPSQLPQAIAHRGYKAAFPENTMAAFRSAVEIGAHAIETDLHLSSDGVVVLSHDVTLKRCFGIDKKVADCDWAYLRTLNTLREPRQPLPRLLDLLEYLAQPGQEHMWVLLDVKKDDDASELLSCIATTIAAVPASRPWAERIMIGCWDANYVRLSLKLLPGFPLTFIGFNLAYASALFPVEHLNFNLYQLSVVGPCGGRFLRKAKENGREVFVWTVNKESWMEWSIRKELDGVITDDPKLFLEVCDRWKGSRGDAKTIAKRGRKRELVFLKPRQVAEILFFYFLLAIYMTPILLKQGSSKQQVRKVLGGSTQKTDKP